ncbi:MAG: glycerophosphodiester phosphodiesterase, partial [Eubacterium sp.]|nr:glycerophosphodiester phosphodiesterase [Eubacterium sp.]
MHSPYVWAHRGASGYAPENTLEAFQLAADIGADGVELDVQLTRDNQIVVCHDETIDRTSNRKGWVKDFTLEELKNMNFDNGNKA